MIGFSLLKNSIQFVELVEQEQTYQIRKLECRKLPIPLTLKAFSDSEQLNALSEFSKELVTSAQLSGEVSIAVDNSLTLIKKMPVDANIGSQDLEKQILWECQQFVPAASLADYRYIYQKLIHASEDNVDYLLLVVFRQQLLEGIKQLLEKLGLSLSQVEVDWLALIRAGNCFYELDKKRLVCLANIGADVIQLLFLQYGEYYFSHRVSLQESEETSELSAWDSPENLARLLQKEIRRVLMENRFDIENQPIEDLYLFGERAESEIIDFLRNETALHVDIMLPQEKLEVIEEVKNSPAYTQFSQECLYCIGTALP